ncbi:hypothetical protein LTR95_004373 [Oleoguttula sp. CCFEE 5521]
MDSPTALVTAKMIAIPLALTSAGYGFSASQNTVPRLYKEPAKTATSIFAHVFHTGGQFVVPSTLLSVASSAFLAYSIPRQRQVWGTVAVTTLAALPWTWVVMMPGIKRLLAISEDEKLQHKCGGSGEHTYLLKKWVGQNYVRASFFLIAGLIGLPRCQSRHLHTKLKTSPWNCDTRHFRASPRSGHLHSMPGFESNPPPGYWELHYDRPHPSNDPQRLHEGLAESRYCDDFRTRNRSKVAQIETWLSTFNLLFRQAQRKEDQSTFDKLFFVLKQAASAVDAGTFPMRDEQAKVDESKVQDSVENEPFTLGSHRAFYHVMQPKAEEEAELTSEERLARARVRIRQAKEKHAVRVTMEAEEDEQVWADGELEASGETTLVEDEMAESVDWLTMD